MLLGEIKDRNFCYFVCSEKIQQELGPTYGWPFWAHFRWVENHGGRKAFRKFHETGNTYFPYPWEKTVT